MVCKLSLGPFCRMEKIKIRDLQNTCKQAGCKHLVCVALAERRCCMEDELGERWVKAVR